MKGSRAPGYRFAVLVLVALVAGLVGGYIYGVRSVGVVERLTTVTTTVYLRASEEVVLRYPEGQSMELDANSDGVPEAFIEVNPWNLMSHRGTQAIYVDISRSTVRAEFDLTGVQPMEWVNGYPEVYIGRKPWGTKYYNGFGVNFPIRVGQAEPFLISFYICLEELEPSMNFNVAADAWIVREEVATALGREPGKGDLEIMVWLFSQNLTPAGRRVGEVSIPMVINGTRVEATFEVWRHDSVEWGGWQYIAFRPRGWSLRCGRVAYNPIDFVREAARYATFDISNHYLLGWEIGTEWGTRSSAGTARFRWVLRDFVAVPGSRV